MANLQLASNLQYLRKCQKLTQKELSDKLSISRQAYSNYETAKRTPDLDSLLRLSKLYNIDLSTLVLEDLRTACNKNASSSSGFSEEQTPYILSINKNTSNNLYINELEQDLLFKYRSLSSEDQRIITGFINNNAKKKF